MLYIIMNSSANKIQLLDLFNIFVKVRCVVGCLVFCVVCYLVGFFYEGLAPEQKYYLCLELFKGMWALQSRGYGKEILFRLSE